MSTNLDNLNAQVTALTSVVAAIENIVKNDPAAAELAATNAGIDATTANLSAVVAQLVALVPAPAPVVEPTPAA